MTQITDLIKCPGCQRKGTMELIIRKKTANAQCEACNETVQSRVPYPKHRANYQRAGRSYPFEIPSVRPLWTEEKDQQTCSQEEWDESHK